MKTYSFRKVGIRFLSVVLAVFSILFGVTWEKHGFCLGDNLLTILGLPAWSNGTQGTHYSAIIALILLFISFFLFARTIKK